MIKTAFISYRYTEEIKDLIIAIKKVLLIKKFSYFDYTEKTYDDNILKNKIIPKLNKCDLFIQILQPQENMLGSMLKTDTFDKWYFDQVDLHNSDIPILEWEYRFFKNRNEFSHSLLCFFNGNINNNEFKNYSKSISNGMRPDIPTTFEEIIDAIYFKINEVRISNETGFVDGLLDTSIETTKIVNAIKNAITGKNTFEQKYLYSTLIGADLWQKLTKRPKGAIRQTYDQFPLKNSATKEIISFQNKFKELFNELKSINENTEINYIILGCGTGSREAEFVEWFNQSYSIKKSSVILIDIASELINMSIKSFNDKSIYNLQYAIMDIETNTTDKIQWIREFYWSQK